MIAQGSRNSVQIWGYKQTQHGKLDISVYGATECQVHLNFDDYMKLSYFIQDNHFNIWEKDWKERDGYAKWCFR